METVWDYLYDKDGSTLEGVLKAMAEYRIERYHSCRERGDSLETIHGHDPYGRWDYLDEYHAWEYCTVRPIKDWQMSFEEAKSWTLELWDTESPDYPDRGYWIRSTERVGFDYPKRYDIHVSSIGCRGGSVGCYSPGGIFPDRGHVINYAEGPVWASTVVHETAHALVANDPEGGIPRCKDDNWHHPHRAGKHQYELESNTNGCVHGKVFRCALAELSAKYLRSPNNADLCDEFGRR